MKHTVWRAREEATGDERPGHGGRPRRDARGHGQGSAVRVLVVEDDEDLRTAVCAELDAAGFEVRPAADLATADAAIAGTQFACLVFDRMLPDGDAISYVQQLRHAGYGFPVLFLTARDSVAD